jgi:Fe-S cluster biogenesis protein NfuA
VLTSSRCIKTKINGSRLLITLRLGGIFPELRHYHGTFHIVLFVAADSDYCSTYVDTYNAGTACDDCAFVKSTLKHAIDRTAFSLFTDAVSAHDDEPPLTPYLMSHSQSMVHWIIKKKIFNYMLSRT